MRPYGGLDTRGLVGAGAWKDRKSAERYERVVVTEEAKRADLLPARMNLAKSTRKARLGKISRCSCRHGKFSMGISL
jgi:hypothetical protein